MSKRSMALTMSLLRPLAGRKLTVGTRMAASAVVKYVQKQDIRADIVLLTMFIIWAIVVGSNTWVADIGAVVVGAVSGWAWLQTRWSSYRRQLGAGLAVLAVCLVALVVTWVM